LPRPRRLDPFGLAALLSDGAALLGAGVTSLCGFVVPLAIVGLLLGLVGSFRALGQGSFRLLFAAAGVLVGGLVLFTALLLPSLLGPVYLTSRAREAQDPRAIQVIPLSGNRGNSGPRDPEWVDASQAALQQGRLYVQVLSVSVRAVKPKSDPTRKLPPVEYLFLRLRTQQAEEASAFGTVRTQALGPRSEKARPTLRDSTGKVCQLRDVQEMAVAETDRRSSVFPVVFEEVVFVFDAPPANLASLRLELPAEAWGGEGVFRFTILGPMVRHEQAGPAGLAGGR
jgi:hypothetical protein